jgi:hypothetical protein
VEIEEFHPIIRWYMSKTDSLVGCRQYYRARRWTGSRPSIMMMEFTVVGGAFNTNVSPIMTEQAASGMIRAARRNALRASLAA